MVGMNNPVVLVTRPRADAQRFVEALKQVAGPFEAVISPAFAYEQCKVEVPQFDSAVFTSKTGVTFAPVGNGRRAYCVGDATAKAAQGAGYEAVSAEGSAEDLIALILEQKPSGVLSHLRGETSRGDVSTRLTAAGFFCTDDVLYRKVWLPPMACVLDLDFAAGSVVIPLFSAETVSILAQWPLSFAGCKVVAISDVVAHAALELDPANITVSDAPNMGSMAKKTARMIA